MPQRLPLRPHALLQPLLHPRCGRRLRKSLLLLLLPPLQLLQLLLLLLLLTRR
jgi:hypothetical protein